MSIKQVAFVGLGNMGLPMARNLKASGMDVVGYEIDSARRNLASESGIDTAASLKEALEGATVAISALPDARHVRSFYLGDEGALATTSEGCLFIDCSTVDVASARDVAVAAVKYGHEMVDSPMSGGVPGAEAGTLTFMVGGPLSAFERAKDILVILGKNIFHAGESGTGCAAKICNNLLLGISMVGVCEAFNLAERLGLEAETLYRISSTATGRCWSLNDYCPVPGPVPAAPSNRDFQGGFSAALMLKDLSLAMEATRESSVATPLGAQAAQVYAMMDLAGMGHLDFSSAIRFLAGRGPPDAVGSDS